MTQHSESDFEPLDDDAKRWWYYAPWTLTNPLWPWFWRGGDEYGRQTIVVQPPLLGALVIAKTGTGSPDA